MNILIFLSFLISSLIAEITMSNTKLDDIISITIPMKSYNVDNPDGESIEFYHQLQPFSFAQIFLIHIPPKVEFVMVQVHSYQINVTLSYSEIPYYSTSVTGTNVGLIKMIKSNYSTFFITHNNSTILDIMVAVQAYGNNAPIPGGCNLEFQVEISPFLLTRHTNAYVVVDFAPAAPPTSFTKNLHLLPNGECNLKPSGVIHEMFYEHSNEGDLTKESYFKSLESMMTLGRIKKNGIVAHEKITSRPMRRIFASYPGTGKTFVVVSRFLNQSAVYVPSFTYGCINLKESNTCLPLETTFSKIFCAGVLFMGLFKCIFGHFFFKTEIFLFSFLSSGFIFYILFFPFLSDLYVLSVAVSCGCVVAIAIVIWGVFEMPIMSLILSNISLGFVVASVIIYPLLDHVDLLVADVNYWGIFIGIVMICPILLLSLAEKANIAACSVIGSFMILVPVDHYIGSNFRYIIVNVIRRATTKGFNLALMAPPFQIKDILLCFCWIALTVAGIKIQLLLMRNRPPYPPRRDCSQIFQWCSQIPRRGSGEHSRLLNNSVTNETGYGSWLNRRTGVSDERRNVTF